MKRRNRLSHAQQTGHERPIVGNNAQKLNRREWPLRLLLPKVSFTTEMHRAGSEDGKSTTRKSSSRQWWNVTEYFYSVTVIKYIFYVSVVYLSKNNSAYFLLLLCYILQLLSILLLRYISTICVVTRYILWTQFRQNVAYTKIRVCVAVLEV